MILFVFVFVFFVFFLFIATMSFAGYFLVRSLLSAFPCLSPISGLIWFGSVYLVTTAGFVADQLNSMVLHCSVLYTTKLLGEG